MRQSTQRPTRGLRPSLDGLEARSLLSASPGHVHAAAALSSQARRFSYTTSDGAHAVITLYGAGSLAGTGTNADGSLNLVFSGTNPSTQIVGKVSGGGGFAPLNSIETADLAPDDFSGIGSSVLNVVNLKNFDLIDGGAINLTGGVHTLILNSVGRSTQVHLRQLPPTFNTSSGGKITSDSLNGLTFQYSGNAQGGLILSGVQGQFAAGTNLVGTPVTQGNPDVVGVNPGPPPAPPGIIVIINHIDGAPGGLAGLASQGAINLDDPNLLTNLSGPSQGALAGSALIDVQGNIQSLRSDFATGLVLNDAGNLNLVKITSATDSVIIGEPFSHAAIPNRSNVTILSTPRTVGDRNGVTIIPGLVPSGPLTLP